MKQFFVTLIGLLLGGAAYAQLPKWVIEPNYDRLYVKVDDCLLQTDSLGTTSLWTMDGKCLFKTEHFVHPFRDGVAVITKKDSNDLIGFVDTFGKFVSMPDNIQVAYNHPFFEDGYLICYESEGYSYYKKDGSKATFAPALNPYPFYRGYAPHLTYDQIDKMKDPYYGYYRADGQAMTYRMLDKGSEKEFEPKNINFLSSISDSNYGVAVIKNKLYIFDHDTQLFAPFLYGDAESEKKRHLVLYGDYEKYFLNLPTDTVEIIAKYGNNQLALLQFDRELHPIRFLFDGDVQTFAKEESAEYKYATDLKPYGENNSFGLATASRQLLPQQFEEIGLRYGNKAFVKLNGKWGVIEIIPNLNYNININKGEEVAFRHRKFDTQIRLDLPAVISAKEARVDIPDSTGCVIDKTSRETKDTESGNYVVYDCSLNIPLSLPDTTTTITYSPVSISYDGIRLFDIPIDIKAWHYKSYNVDPIESETSISNGVATFTINVNAEKTAGESDYFFHIEIQADSIYAQYEKLSETRYKCLVSNLQEGNNNLNILVIEKGCPPSKFPFEIYYTKPVPRKKKQESVVVRKKTPEAPNPELQIEL